MLSPVELRQFSQISWSRSTWALISDWLLIAGIFALAIVFPNPWVWGLCWFLIGRQQLALAILMHDGSHRRLYQSQKLNDRVGQLAMAAPLLFAMDSYKKLHLKHHLNPLAEDDPDLSLISGYPISKASFARKILRDVSGFSYFKFIRYFIFMARKNASAKSGPKTALNSPKPQGLSRGEIFGSIVFSQLAIFGALWVVGHPLYYFGLWLLPAMTILQVLLRIRGIAEHAGYRSNEDQRLNARTVIHPVQTFFFAPHGVNYHIEHHLYPSIPFYRLPEIHRILRERGALPEANLYSGYHRVLADLIH